MASSRLRAACLLPALWLVSHSVHAAEASQRLDAAAARRIEAQAKRLMSERDVPSYALAVVGADGPLYARAWGMANRSEGRVATTSTIYDVGSVTKTFTAALVFILRDEGRLTLDDPWSKHLPADVRTSVDANGREPTIRHLLTHTSGLERDPPHRKTGVSVGELYEALNRAKLQGQAGQRWSYSNLGFGLLGHLAERAAGERYEELLKAKLLRPLGMNDTTISLTAEQRDRLAAHYWVEDSDRRERPPWRWTEIVGFGAVSSSLDDMVRYVGFLLAPEDRQGPLSSASQREMLGDPIDEHEDSALTQRLGWMGSHVRGKALWYRHGGEIDGHSAHVAFSPPLGLGVVVLSNLGGDTAAALGDFTEQILDAAATSD